MRGSVFVHFMTILPVDSLRREVSYEIIFFAEVPNVRVIFDMDVP